MYKITYPIGTPNPQDVAIAQMRRHVGPDDAAFDDAAHFYPYPRPFLNRAACGVTVQERERGHVVIADGPDAPGKPLCAGCFAWVCEQREYEARLERAGRD